MRLWKLITAANPREPRESRPHPLPVKLARAAYATSKAPQDDVKAAP